jgi:predicted dehydrogenase
MDTQDRRRFLLESSRAGMGWTLGAVAATATRKALAAPSDRLVLAVVGVRGRGQVLAANFADRPDCQVAYLCDVDQSLLESRAQLVAEAQGSPPKLVADFRRALDDPQVDAVVIATPDHWHALATIWSCQAGKDVYVEKPVSHSPWEGRKMVEAARRYDRVVQVGTQSRSAAYTKAAKAYLDSGALGSVHLVRVLNQKEWRNAAAAADSDPPQSLDWDMWNGPAHKVRYNVNYHNAWNHFWRYSGGDIINDGVHQMDLARWLIGKRLPLTVSSTGGRYVEQGAFETPDTQVTVYQFDDLVMTFELTLYTPYMLKTDPVVRESDMFPYWLQNATRIEMYGSDGLMIVGRHGGGWQVFGRPKDRQPVVVAQHYGRFPDREHQQNFVDSVRNRTVPNADIEEGHLSTLLCQFANISYRTGGRVLKIDSASESFVGDDDANRLLRREYRSPWVVPETV